MATAHACHRHVMISGKVYRTVSDGCWSVPRRIEDMGAMRVTRQAISPMPELLSYWLPLEDAQGDDPLPQRRRSPRMVSAAPQRFVGLGAVPLQDIDAAIRELEYVSRSCNFAGVEIASHVNGTSIGDARFEPFFAAAEKMGAAIFVHALRPAGQDRIVGPFAEQAVCFPGDIGLACASMITGGIGARHPKLRIAFSHGGGVDVDPAAAPGARLERVPEGEGSAAESPAVTARRFYYDQLVFDPRGGALRRARPSAHTQICIGTDYPFAHGRLAIR